MLNWQRGASATGYGLVVGLISIVALAAITSTGSQTEKLFGTVADNLTEIVPSPNPSPSASPVPDGDPDSFTFTDVNPANGGSVITSNTITLSGMNQTSAAVLSGDGSALISVNGGGFTSSATVGAGDQVQLRVTASTTPSQQVDVTLTIGSTTDTWSVVTGSGTVFLAGTFMGTDIYAPRSCASGDYYCQAEVACEAATGADCVWQSYNCTNYPDENGAFYPTSDPNSMGIPTGGSSDLNWAVTSSELETGATPGDYTSNSYGNLCACYDYGAWQYETLRGCGVGIWSPY